MIECIIIAIYRFDFSLAIHLASFQLVVNSEYTYSLTHTHTQPAQFLFNEIWCRRLNEFVIDDNNDNDGNDGKEKREKKIQKHKYLPIEHANIFQ